MKELEKWAEEKVRKEREIDKLIELVEQSYFCDIVSLCEDLVSKGVTVQQEAKLYWKPVKQGEWNLTCSACDSHLGCREDANFCPKCGAKFVLPKAVMPQPPKGE